MRKIGLQLLAALEQILATSPKLAFELCYKSQGPLVEHWLVLVTLASGEVEFCRQCFRPTFGALGFTIRKWLARILGYRQARCCPGPSANGGLGTAPKLGHGTVARRRTMFRAARGTAGARRQS